MYNVEDFQSIASSNASMAVDNPDNLEEPIGSYAINVIDTVKEYVHERSLPHSEENKLVGRALNDYYREVYLTGMHRIVLKG